MSTDPEPEILRPKSLFHPVTVQRLGEMVLRDAGPWTPTVHSLLRHLEQVGFAGAPRVVGTGFDSDGRETITFVEGEFLERGPWSLEAIATIGQLLRDLHTATASFRPPQDAVWWAWFGRSLGGPAHCFGHCDVGPWNIVTRQGLAFALIDWERAGPVDPLVDLVQACWLNCKLYDDIVAEREGLPPLAERAFQLRALLDAYGLAASQRDGFVERILEFVVHATANEADEAAVTPDTTSNQTAPELVWALSWRARSAAWIYRNRAVLQNALA